MNTPQEFAELRSGLRALERTGFAGGAALATLTRTRGPAFRRPGARMLVQGDGKVLRSLAGGCPEADLVTRAKDVIAKDTAQIVRYNQDYGLDALVESGCGGELEVLIEPLARPSDLRFLDAVEQCVESRGSGLLATAYACDETCLQPRPRRLVWNGERACDELDDSRLSEAVLSAEGGGAARVQRFETDKGRYDVLLEKLLAPQALAVIGSGAVALALARLGALLGWNTTLVDHRPDAPEPVAVHPGVRWQRAAPEQLGVRLSLDRRSAVVVMTHNLERDIAYLSALREQPLAYLGAVGSRSRAEKIFAATGLSPERLRAPAGMDLGSETPEEIALAIASEILALGTGHRGGFLSTSSAPIH